MRLAATPAAQLQLCVCSLRPCPAFPSPPFRAFHVSSAPVSRSDVYVCHAMQGAAAQLALMMSMLGQSLDGDGSGLPDFLEQMGDEVSAIAQRPTPRDGTSLSTTTGRYSHRKL